MGKTSGNIGLIVLVTLVCVCEFLGAINYHEATCGIQYVRGGRIVNGTAAYRGEFPWAVSIEKGGTHYCGGALVTDKFVVSAAHCYDGAKKGLVAVVGKYYTSKDDPPFSRKVTVKQVTQHPGYRFPFFKDDIAILELSESVCFDPFKQPVCLPDPNTDNLIGREGIVIGWGWTGEPVRGGKPAGVLQKVRLPVVYHTVCEKWFKEAFKTVSLSSNQFCAGYKEGNKDSCLGDSGGPYMLRSKKTGRFHLHGVVSAGIGCARPNLPGVYTRVAPYVPWIQKLIGITN